MVTDRQAAQVRLQGELPRLVVEVLSPGAANRARDETDKLGVYERAGVPAYWIVDPEGASVRGFEHDGTCLGLVTEATGQEEAAFERPFPVRFRPADLMG
ncbi:MAG: Uma2 family endonuclease [Acidimicrobiales bacterium]